MSEQNPVISLPRRILLATDLSARCDRALDRAAALAQSWNAELVAVHALEQTDDFYRLELERRLPSWRQSPDPARFVAEQIRQDALQDGVSATAIAEKGDPTEIIVRAAASRACDLIVTGIARDETLGRFGLGTTVIHLSRQSRLPLLAVKTRVRGPYRKVLVATDFSYCSLIALQAAMAFFPGAELTIFHAYDTPFSGMAGRLADTREAFRDAAAADCAAFLVKSGVPSEQRRRFQLILEPGRPSDMIAQFVRDRGVELVIAGAHGQRGFLEGLLGSTSSQILSSIPCDVLIARGLHAHGDTSTVPP